MLTLKQLEELPKGTVLYIAGGKTPNVQKVIFDEVLPTRKDYHHVMHSTGGCSYEWLVSRDRGGFFLSKQDAIAYQTFINCIAFDETKKSLEKRIASLQAELQEMESTSSRDWIKTIFIGFSEEETE